ncbi:MAG: tRNA dihydrouridine synthase DusB [Calditrichaeota bacterium]|nr:tRNA dihydrouridine synthase DusB [Calditrichota bacterium]
MMIPRARLGPLDLESPVVLAPMAGYTDSPMRRLAKRFGAGLVFSEMLSGEALRRGSLKTLELARFTPEERPIFLQFVVGTPETAAEVARMLESLEPDGLDLNFGCPARKVVQSSGGAALLRDVPLLGKIVEAAVKATRLPVSLKIRCGWDEQSLNAVEIAHVAAESGAMWITVHARTRSDFRTGKACWEWIGQVKERATIPVIGNGDVREAVDVVALRKQTGCDAVMIGRAAIGYPFIFREANALLANQARLETATPEQRWQAARQQLEWMIEFCGEERAVRHFRKHAISYLRGLPHSASVKDEVVRLPSAFRVLHRLESYFLSLPNTSAQGDPNIVERVSWEKN